MAKGVLIYDVSFAVSLAASVVRSGDGRFFATAKGQPLPSGPWQRAPFDIGLLLKDDRRSQEGADS